MHYYSFNIADYRKDTTHLSPAEHYIYRSLLDWLYLDEAPIPKDNQKVLRRLSLGLDEEPSLTNVLNDFFILRDDGWVQERVMFEINEYKKKLATLRANGSKGGRPPKNQKVSKRLAIVKATKNHKPLTKNHSVGRFTPPTAIEIADYCVQTGLVVDQGKFADFYESKNWMVGKNKMKSWQAALRNWARRDRDNSPSPENTMKRLTDRSWADGHD